MKRNKLFKIISYSALGLFFFLTILLMYFKHLLDRWGPWPILVLLLALPFLYHLFAARTNIGELNNDSILKHLRVPKEYVPRGERSLKIHKIELLVLKDALREFQEGYSLDCFVSDICQEGDYTIVSISKKMDYLTFARLVNYLSYCQFKKKYFVTGWYGMSENIHDNKGYSLSGKMLMLYIPPTDLEEDVVYLVTKDGHHFKQKLYRPFRLIAVDRRRKFYNAPSNKQG